MLEGKSASSVFSGPEISALLAGKNEISAFRTSFTRNGTQEQFFVRPYVMRGDEGVIGAILTLGKRAPTREARSGSPYVARYNFANIVGVDGTIRRPLEMAELLAAQETRILITGETGTGKELLAHSIHNASPRVNGPFVPINCAAIPRELLEAELFGYKEGAFTGARRGGQIGKIELADCGTLFLDEISLMPLELQAKLLRVLEDGIITRLGDSAPIRVNLRIIAATNDNLFEMANKGEFRKDLYFRLSVAEVRLPPLRERLADIVPLCDFILGNLCRKMNRAKVAVSKEALALLMAYPWPGNIRELENVLEICGISAARRRPPPPCRWPPPPIRRSATSKAI
jgi:transcriptional regulator with PAS, ATPase and Fis domain